ncbi:MAG TPA: GntR family transcriptional regulator [Anaerolineaceae bacterium]|nr:GntR family transcriptional regulator [Anaerolineaceae bacterium]
MNRLAGKIKVDFRSSEPIYLQIARQIEQLVVNGDLQLGDQLPTVRELATELRINFNTVTRAYKVLDESRIISTQRGRGTYIWEEPQAEKISGVRKEGLNALFRQCIHDAFAMGYTEEEIIRAFSEQIQAWDENEDGQPSSVKEIKRTE